MFGAIRHQSEMKGNEVWAHDDDDQIFLGEETPDKKRSEMRFEHMVTMVSPYRQMMKLGRRDESWWRRTRTRYRPERCAQTAQGSGESNG